MVGFAAGLVEGRLDIVVGVQQDGGCVAVGAWPGSDDGLASIGGLGKAYVGEAELGELAQNPLGGGGALLGGNWRGSATDRMATSSPSSSRACGIRPASALAVPCPASRPHLRPS